MIEALGLILLKVLMSPFFHATIYGVIALIFRFFNSKLNEKDVELGYLQGAFNSLKSRISSLEFSEEQRIAKEMKEDIAKKEERPAKKKEEKAK